jgi:lipoprotein-anchoring transpeptidase ErfK/SrfK
MKTLISPNWMRLSKLFLMGAVFSLSIYGTSLSQVWAHSTQQSIQQQMQLLQQSEQRWIQINLTTQRLTAWEGNKPVYAIIISSGKKSTPTQTGVFKIQSKHAIARMQGDGYDISNVPYVMYYEGGYAIHGAFWVRKFGTPISHGCINVAPDHAKWLFQWASQGTPVIVHN